MTEHQQHQAAHDFADYWKNRGDEKSETQQFWMSLLHSVFGMEEPQKFIEFEKRVQLTHVSFIDAYIESTKVLIEQKSFDIDLHKGYKQSDGSVLTPFQQAKRYANELPYSLRPRWVVVSNFQSFLVYDMENPNGEPFEILLENLQNEYFRLSFLVETENSHLQREMEVSFKAGELVGKLYDALLPQYRNPESDATLHSLNVLCVRLVFCLYSEDAGQFGKHDAFHDYLSQFDAAHIRKALLELFEILNQKPEERDPYLEPELAAFPYVNGGLFADMDVEIPNITEEIRDLLLNKASLNFDWSEISPTIFGSVFESTLNPETRRKGGMHYTSIENIHKVIDPLFLDGLKNELATIRQLPSSGSGSNSKTARLKAFQRKLASLKFLDPACGSGNFLTETYLSIRRLENEILQLLNNGQVLLNVGNPIQVSINQFYGIEINDFAVTVAKTALWIAESQMMKQTENIVMTDIDFFPLTSNANIVEGNALRVPWTEWEVADEPHQVVIAGQTYVYPRQESPASIVSEPVVRYGNIDLYTDEIHLNPKGKEPEFYHVDFDYIMGNPPFVGYSLQSKEQKQDLVDLFGKKWKNVGKLDYVSGWYLKAAKLMRNSNIHTALVSTNSITQGEQVANLWRPLFEEYGMQIDFAYRTFRWDSESTLKAHVHCVIIGFSKCGNGTKTIFTESDNPIQASNINPYLIDAPTVWIESRAKSLCDVPQMIYGNKPVDGGFLFLTESEKIEFLKKEPTLEKFIRQIYGSEEYINNRKRYCLWLVGASPMELRKSPLIMERIGNVRKYRLNSTKEATRQDAETPTLFQEIRHPNSDYIIVPRVSSENRRYVPMGFLTPEIIVNDSVQIIPNATLYHFGILTSFVHMAWMRVVCGRLKSDYRYSKDIVYNNFPWPTPTEGQKAKIEQTAQAILDARAKYPDCSLADLYDEATMPPELRKAHKENDHAVMAAYGFSTKMTESEYVAELMRMYEDMAR